MAKQPLPHSVELEEGLLGSCILDPHAWRVVNHLVRPDDFYIVKNGWIWEAYRSVKESGQAVDYIILCDELEKEGKLEGVGGTAYVTSLINRASVVHAVDYAHRVADLAERRRTIRTAGELAKAAFNLNGTFAPEKAKIARGLRRDVSGGTDTVSVRDVMQTIFDNVDYNIQHPIARGEARFLSTGLPDVDRLTGGLYPGLHVVAAVTHVGKTAFCMAVGANVARAGGKVLFVSPEMTPTQLIERLVCAEARVDSDDLDTGLIKDKPEDFARFVHAQGVISGWDIVVSQARSMHDITAQVYRESPLNLVVIDGVELVTGAASDAPHIARGEIGKWAASLAIDPDILAPVLLPAQIATKQVMNRSDKRPLPGDVYQTSELEFVTDVMLTLHRRDRYVLDTAKMPPDYIMEVTLWKHRLKKRRIPGTVKVRFGEYGEVSSLQADHGER